MNFIKVSCLIAQAQCLTNWGDCIIYIKLQAPVVQTLDSAIHRINLYPVDGAIGFPNTYPLDSDLSGG